MLKHTRMTTEKKRGLGLRSTPPVVIYSPSSIPQSLCECLMSYCCGSLSVLGHSEYVSLVLISKLPHTEINKTLMVFMVFSRASCVFSSFPCRKSEHFLGNY